MKKIFFYCFVCFFLNACGENFTPSQYDELLKGKNSEAGMVLLIKEARSGDAELQYYLGTLHEKGLYTPMNRTDAAEWYRLAAQQGLEKGKEALLRLLNDSSNDLDKKLYVELGDYYRQGLYVSQDRKKALSIYLDAADSDDIVRQKLINLLNQMSSDSCIEGNIDSCVEERSEAQYQLAMLYRTGRFLDKDETKSKQLIKLSSEAGHNEASIKRVEDLLVTDEASWALAHKILKGIEEHSKWSSKVLASLNSLREGNKITKEENALQLFQLGAELGNPKSAMNAFFLHYSDKLANAKKEKAGYYLWLAAKFDYEDSRDRLAHAYLHGEHGIPVDHAAAVYLAKHSDDDLILGWICTDAYYPNVPESCIDGALAKMVRKGHPFAQYIMGDIYESGAGKEKDIKHAISLYKLASAQGEYAAKVALAELYLEGKTGRDDSEKGLAILHGMESDGEIGAAQVYADYAFEKKDYQQALTLSLQAEQENWVSDNTYYHLYQLYRGDKGIPQDIDKSNYYLEMAVGENHYAALYEKAMIVFDNIDSENDDKSLVDKRIVEAIDLLTSSAHLGYMPAILKLEEHYKSLNKLQQAAIWTLEAAAHGDVSSQKAIGEIFDKKKTLSAASVARHWYSLAEIQGDREATAWMAKYGVGKLNADSKGNLCSEVSNSCGSKNVIKKPLKYFRQLNLHKEDLELRLFADGSVEYSDELEPRESWLPYFKANVTQVWPTHCGFAMQRATGSGVLLFPQDEHQCQPTSDVIWDALKYGVKQVVTNNTSSTSLLLGNNQVVSWGQVLSGEGMISPALHSDDTYTTLDDELKVKRAVANDVVKVAIGSVMKAALKSDGNIYMWGPYSDEIGHQLPGKYKDIMSNGYFGGYCTRDIDNLISCWEEKQYQYPHRSYPKNIQQFTLVERALMALSIDKQGMLEAWPMFNLGEKNYSSVKLPASLSNYSWTAIEKGQMSDGYATVLTREDGKKFYVRYSTGQFLVRPFKQRSIL